MITIVTAPGTVAQWWEGYPADIARWLTDIWLIARGQCWGPPDGLNWRWQGIQYPAVAFPMRPSILAGIESTVAALNDPRNSGKFVLTGYSQGAIVVCMVWLHDILNPTGRLHHRLNDCLGVITYGNPMRAPGVAYGNLIAGKPIPPKRHGHITGGIAGPACLRPEQCLFPLGHPLAGSPAVIDFANPGDLYTDAPIGSAPWVRETEIGHNETMIYEMILDFNGSDILSFTREVFEILNMPWRQLVPLVLSIWDGLFFFGQGTAPHGSYDVRPAIGHLDQLGRMYA